LKKAKREALEMNASHSSWIAKFLAIVRYEILWNIRKKKFIGILVVAFALTTLSLAGDHIVSAFTGEPVQLNPDFLINYNIGMGGFAFFLFAIVTAMNTISAEFESGTIVSLLAKPVSRTTVFIGKLFAALLTLLATYCFLTLYMTIGSFVVYGPQNNLHLVPLSLLGALFSTSIWVSIALLFGTISRSSLIAALGPLGIWLGTSIIGSILGVLAGQGWILTYILGSGNSGSVGGPPPLGVSVSTGTDSIGPNLINFFLHPSWEVTYYKIDIGGSMAGQILWEELYSEPISTVVLTSVMVALVYFIVFTIICWYVFRQLQVTE
jgi:ABC-type transport system involved in multi-copper enzyme maturation permease subunit